MGYELKVSTDDVITKATKVKGEAASLEQQVAQLTNDMAALAGTWTGQASSKFQELYQGWKTSAAQIQQQLEQIGQSLNTAGTAYETVEAQNVASL